MNKKGLKLIIILIIVVILVAASLMIAPILKNMVESSKREEDLKLAEIYIKAGEKYYAEAEADLSKKAKLGKENVLDELEVSDKKATGKLYIEEDGSINMALLIDGKCYKKLASQSLNEIDISQTDECKLNLKIGYKFTIGTESFYVIGFEDNGTKVKALAEWNLEIGNSSNSTSPADIETNKQSPKAIGWKEGYPSYATRRFSQDSYWFNVSNQSLDSKYGSDYPVWVYNDNSYLKPYVDKYKVILEEYGVNIIEARVMKKEEMDYLYNYYNKTTGQTLAMGDIMSWAPNWLYQTAYWTGSACDPESLYSIYSNGKLYYNHLYHGSGLRPVIVINASDL